MATSAYSILARSRQGQSLHPGMQAPAGPATASGRKGATFPAVESGGGGGASADKGRGDGGSEEEVTEGARER